MEIKYLNTSTNVSPLKAGLLSSLPKTPDLSSRIRRLADEGSQALVQACAVCKACASVAVEIPRRRTRSSG